MSEDNIFNADEITLDNFEGIVKCRKKPIVIHAVQLNYPEGFKVTTLEGVMKGKPGDYLMFGINGEKYPCDKDIFEKSYDIVKDEDKYCKSCLIEQQHRCNEANRLACKITNYSCYILSR